MAPQEGRASSSEEHAGLVETGSEVVNLVVEYAKQETLGPLKSLGRFLLWGMLGSLLLSLGLLLLLVALLRALQGETGSTFRGNLSWLPYVITAAAAMTVIALSVWRITKGPARRMAGPPRRTA